MLPSTPLLRRWIRAISSGGERLLHTQEATGSKPVSPTIPSLLVPPRSINSRRISNTSSSLLLVPRAFENYGEFRTSKFFFAPPPSHFFLDNTGGLCYTPCQWCLFRGREAGHDTDA